MNHQPFETWLLSDDALDKDQTRSLQAHLATCDQCAKISTSWGQVHQLFEATAEITPEPGFSMRWQERLAAQNKQAHHDQSWIVLGSISGMALFLLILICIQIAPFLRSPENLLLVMIYRLGALVTYTQAAQYLALSMLSTILKLLPLPVWITLLGTFSMFFVLWLGMLKQLSASRRINL